MLLLRSLDAEVAAAAQILQKHGLSNTLCTLLLEGTSRDESHRPTSSDDLDFVERLTLKGQWKDLLAYVEPLHTDATVGTTIDRVEYLLLRQQFLESLHWHQGCSDEYPWAPPAGIKLDSELDMARTVGVLRRLEVVSSEEEFVQLCELLDMEDFRTHTSLLGWSVGTGRLDCCSKLVELLNPLFLRPTPKDSAHIQSAPTHTRVVAQAEVVPVPVLVSVPVSMRAAPQVVTPMEPAGPSLAWTIDMKAAQTESNVAPAVVSKGLPRQALEGERRPVLQRPPDSSSPKKQNWDAVVKEAIVPSTLFYSTSPLRCMSVLPELVGRELVAIGSNSHHIHVISSRGGDARVESELLDAHRGSVYCMDWQGEGRGEEGQLVTGSNDKSLRLSRVQLGVVQHEAVVLKGHNGTIRCAAFAPTRGVLASAGSGDLRPRLWRTDTGVCTGLLEAHPDTVHGLCWLDQHTLLSACEGGTLRAHDTRSPATAWSLNAGRGLCCLASAGSLVVAGCVGGWLGMIDPSVQRIVAMEKRHGDDIRAVAVWQHEVAGSSKDFTLLTTSFDATCEIVKVSVQQTPSLAVIAKLVGHSDKVLGAKFTSAGNVLTTGADGKALLWKPSSK